MENETTQVNAIDTKESKKIKKALKIAKRRPLKNLLIWFIGFISTFVLIGAGAFICVKVIPVKSYLGSNTADYVREDLAEKSVLDLALNIKDYKVSDFPVIDKAIDSIVEDSGISQYVSVNTKVLKDIQFNNTDAVKDKILSALKLNPEVLGDKLKDIEAFTTAEKANLTVAQAKAKEDFDKEYKTYYYIVKQDGQNVYERAFNDDKKAVVGVNDSTELYFPALSDVALSEVGDMFSNILGRVQAIELIEQLSDNPSEAINKLLKDKSVTDLAELDINDVELSTFLDIPTEQNGQKNKDLYDVLCSAVGGGITAEEIKVGDLTGLDMKNVQLSVVATSLDESLKEIMCDATGKAWEEITINDMKGENFVIDDVKLSAVATSLDDTLKSVMCDATGKVWEEITINDMANGNFSMDSVKLSVIISDESILNILCDISQVENGQAKPTKEAITVGHLNNIDIKNIVIGNVIDLEEGSTLYNILADIYGEENVEDVTVGQIQNIDINLVKFGSVIKQKDKDGNDNKLYSILQDAFDCETISDVRSLTIGTITEGLDINSIKLSTVMGNSNSDNKIIDALLKDEEATIADIGKKINELDLSLIFDDNCFVENASGRYYKTEKDGKTVYTLQSVAGAKRYDVSEDAKVWLFLMYDGSVDGIGKPTFDAEGYRLSYTENGITYGMLQDKVGEISATIVNATVRELSISGILTGSFRNRLYSMSFMQVLEELNKIPS